MSDCQRGDKPPDVPPAERPQKLLFAGLNCLPDQLDLFPTDGTEESKPQAEGRSIPQEPLA